RKAGGTISEVQAIEILREVNSTRRRVGPTFKFLLHGTDKLTNTTARGRPAVLCSTSDSRFRQDRHLVMNRIRSASAALLFLGCLVTLTSAFNLPNRSSEPLVALDFQQPGREACSATHYADSR